MAARPAEQKFAFGLVCKIMNDILEFADKHEFTFEVC